MLVDSFYIHIKIIFLRLYHIIFLELFNKSSIFIDHNIHIFYIFAEKFIEKVPCFINIRCISMRKQNSVFRFIIDKVTIAFKVIGTL